MGICDDSGFFDFSDSCVRASWSAIFPAALVFALCLTTIPTPEPLQNITRLIKAPFQPFLTLPEAEALDEQEFLGDELDDIELGDATPPPFWRTLVFGWIGLVEALVWLAVGFYNFVSMPDNPWGGIRPILVAFAWLYATIRPIARPVVTAPYDLLYLYFIDLAGAILLVGGVIFDHHVVGVPLPPIIVSALIANLVAILVLLAVVLTTPLAIPNKRIKKEDIVRLHVAFHPSSLISDRLGLGRVAGGLHVSTRMDILLLGLPSYPKSELFYITNPRFYP